MQPKKPKSSSRQESPPRPGDDLRAVAVSAAASPSPLREFCASLPPERRRLVIEREHGVPHTVVARLGEPMGVLTEGLGMNLPPSFQKNQDRAFPVTDHDWDRLATHLDWLGIKMLRYWLWGDVVLPQPGRLDREHVYVERLRRFDAWAQRRGARLILDLSGMPAWLRYPTPKSEPRVLAMYTGPRDLQAYVEHYALPVVRHVVNDRKLESVRYLCLFNEPFNIDVGMDTFYTPPGVDPFQRYVELHAELRRRLDAEGITRERLGLIGPNTFDLYLQPLQEMQRRGLDFVSQVAFVDEHAYRMRFDYLPEAHHIPTMTMTETIERYLRPAVRSAHAAGKPYVLTEYSCFYYIAPDGPTRHESAITEAEFVIRALAEGVGGALRYSLINGGEADGRWQCVNTTDGSYTPVSNSYYAYAVLARYTPRGGKLHRVESTATGGRQAYVHSVAIEYPPQDRTVLVVNDHPGENIAFELADLPVKPLVAWQTDATYKHQSVPLQEGRVLLPPMSVTAITTFTTTPTDPARIEL